MGSERRERMNALGARLRALRADAGLTGAVLAQRAGVGQPTVSKVETGRMVPSSDVLDRLSRALGLDEPTSGEVRELLAAVEAAVDTAPQSEPDALPGAVLDGAIRARVCKGFRGTRFGGGQSRAAVTPGSDSFLSITVGINSPSRNGSYTAHRTDPPFVVCGGVAGRGSGECCGPGGPTGRGSGRVGVGAGLFRWGRFAGRDDFCLVLVDDLFRRAARVLRHLVDGDDRPVRQGECEGQELVVAVGSLDRQEIHEVQVGHEIGFRDLARARAHQFDRGLRRLRAEGEQAVPFPVDLGEHFLAVFPVGVQEVQSVPPERRFVARGRAPTEHVGPRHLQHLSSSNHRSPETPAPVPASVRSRPRSDHRPPLDIRAADAIVDLASRSVRPVRTAASIRAPASSGPRPFS
ncbi:helix-turn-helix domain-containing protein [Streptomyces sp. MNU76]|uniref:helix-turn-helix domain-containing protein n=1 Tax=Streptomyces sp. MNU76 TaxID=2560026 RepID=UPI0035A91B40